MVDICHEIANLSLNLNKSTRLDFCGSATILLNLHIPRLDSRKYYIWLNIFRYLGQTSSLIIILSGYAKNRRTSRHSKDQSSVY